MSSSSGPVMSVEMTCEIIMSGIHERLSHLRLS